MAEPNYAANCRHYKGRTLASCSFRVYGCPDPDMSGGVIYAEGTGLTTEEVRAALIQEANYWPTGGTGRVEMTGQGY